MDEKKSIEVSFKIEEIKKISHSEINFKEYGIKSSEVSNGDYNVSIGIKFEVEESTIEILVNSRYHLKNGENEDINLFELNNSYIFKIKNFKKVFNVKKRDENDYDINIPDEFIANLLNISIAGARGMQAVLNTVPEYKKLYIPLLNTMEIIKDFRGIHKKASKKM